MKMMRKINIITLIIILTFTILNINGNAIAISLNFKQVIEIGLKNNDSLKDIRQEIEGLQRDIEKTKAGQDWQINLDANYDLAENTSTLSEDSSSESDGNLEIGINKDYSFNFSVGPTINIDTDEYSPEYTVDISQELFPGTPPDSDQELYSQKKELEKLKINLRENRKDQLVSWIESYLNLIRLKEKQKVYTAQLNLAQKELKQLKAMKEFGEASEVELLESQVFVKEARYQLKNTKKEFQESKEEFYQELGLNDNQQLILDTNEEPLKNLKAKVSKSKLDSNETGKLLEQALMNDYDLRANLIENEVFKQELKWLKKEGNTDINLTGEYSSTDDEYTIGLNLSHILYDGGQHDIKIADKKAEIEDTSDEYQTLKKQLKLELKEKQNQIELSQDQLSQKQLTYEKSVLKKKIAQKQFEQGVINDIEYKEYKLTKEEEAINLASAEDDLFVSKLNLLALLKNEDYLKEFK